jgi:hypothetical protein
MQAAVLLEQKPCHQVCCFSALMMAIHLVSVLQALLLLGIGSEVLQGVNALAPDPSALVAELKELRAKSKDGVILVTDEQLKKFGGGKTRPYQLVVFLTARQVCIQADLVRSLSFSRAHAN